MLRAASPSARSYRFASNRVKAGSPPFPPAASGGLHCCRVQFSLSERLEETRSWRRPGAGWTETAEDAASGSRAARDQLFARRPGGLWRSLPRGCGCYRSTADRGRARSGIRKVIPMQMIRIRIKETGQITDMIPAVARAMILGGTAEDLSRPGKVETMAGAGGVERAVTSAAASWGEKEKQRRAEAHRPPWLISLKKSLR